jgi:long-chain acyl-CoA synthetase
MLNLATVLDYSEKEDPGKTALVFGDTRLTYAELAGAANKIANGLVRAGIEKGDKVALSCPNLPYFPMVYYAVLKTGAAVVPLNVLLKRDEIAYHLKDSDAKAYFCFQGTPELPMAKEGYAGFQAAESCMNFWVITADPAADSPIEGVKTLGQLMGPENPDFETVDTSPEDSAVILYTSGTTGFPKGAELTHSNMVMNASISREMLNLTGDDVFLVALPLFHSFGQTVLMNAGISAGGTLVMISRFEAGAVLRAMLQESVTIFAGVPTMYWQILNYKDPKGELDIEKIAGNLRVGVSGAASLPVEIIKGIEAKYNIPILEGYGLSETSPVATFNQLHKQRKPGSIGSPVWGIEVKVVDKQGAQLPVGTVGELVIRGSNVMKSYYKKPEATQAAFFKGGWLRTGDLAKMDEDGYFYIVDRLKDMVIRGGYNVYPREIEEVLMTHPAVSLAAVVGVPDRRYGEEVKAFVVLKEKKNITGEDLVAWSKSKMASYKYPRMIEIRDTLPMTATGKILKKELRE